MNRNFTKSQRLALAKYANWKCQLCGCQLTQNFHADHIIPFSKGGITDVSNGQALCPKCNMQKGNTMSGFKLREWQTEAIEKMKNEFTDTQSILIHATPGGGKTVVALHGYKELRGINGYKYLLVVAPTTEIQDNWIREGAKFGLTLTKDITNLSEFRTGEYDGIVTTFQTVASQTESFRILASRHNVFCTVDEAHHPSSGNSWGEKLKNAVDKSINILMLTGTPWTADGNYMPFVEYDDKGFVKTAFSYSKKEAIIDDVCRVVSFHPLDLGNFKFKNGEEYKNIQEGLDDGKNPYSYAIREIETFRRLFEEADIELTHLRDRSRKRAGGLIIAPDIETAHKFKDAVQVFTGGKQIPEIVHSKAENASAKIGKFRDSEERWIISVNMISEGVDIKRLQVCIFLGNAITKMRFIQIVGRIERLTSTLLLSNKLERESHFHCLSHPLLLEWIKEIEEDQREAVELSEEKKEREFEQKGTREFKEDELEAFELFKTDYIARGVEVEEDIFHLAYELRSQNKYYGGLPFYILCVVAQGMKSNDNEEESIAYQDNAVPLDVQKENIRKIMSKEINRKLAMAGLIKEYNIQQKVNLFINRAVGVKSVASSSMEKLEERLDFIYKTGAEQWIH